MNKPITLCDRCDVVMNCLLDYDGIPCRKNRTVEPTNADRIRSMTDEELAMWLHDRQAKTWFYGTWSRDAWCDWLRQEVIDA